ncbi:family 78 glycoside hydrolase catalytic domain [Actinoplanes regularis]|uniref:family 78 glycoside hydrolase catalytic domain n=1 Tax=Actinoplanes regularis TaxID=52697 RepID=UPI0024A5B4C8|nr:family 78 glycoside hydrolase catalytic domain [Actinoplanes regularis]GLW27600.1 rhamnosidase [Actinoplanes regularis]
MVRTVSRPLSILACLTLAAAAVVPGDPARAAAPVPLNGAHWIWYPEGNPATQAPPATRYLRRTFTAPAGPYTDAQLVVTGDDTVDVWLNGSYLTGSARRADSWKQAAYVDLGSALKTGSNTLLVAARNTSLSPAGVLGHLRVASAAGVTDLVTDSSWQAAQTVDERLDGTWTGAADLGAYGTGPWASAVAAPDPNAGSPITVTGLTTEHTTNPIGVDRAAPLFGWRLLSGTTGQTQGRYQLWVGRTAGAADVWDSGPVASATSTDVAYGGPALTADTTYHWRVRVWDAQGRPSPWSADATFDTGLRGSWPAAFIGVPNTLSLSGASWIWHPEGDPATSVPAGTRYFRRAFTAASATTATLVVTGDDTADVWLNGASVSGSRRVTDSWKRATTVTVRVPAGANTIAVAATNMSAGPAGVVAKLGSILVTDGSWKSAPTGPSGWEQPGFDDSSWVPVHVTAAYGGGPWGTQVTVPAPAPYLRKGFVIGKPVARARLFTTALGLHDTYLNGTRVGTERLAPGWTDYTKRLQYRGYDVTAQLQQGDNVLGAVVGNGWYSGNVGFAGSRLWGASPWYSAQLVVRYTDGTSSTLLTDSSWRSAPSSILADDLYQGEDQDARRAVADWNRPGFDDAAWATATVSTAAKPTLVAQVDPGVTVQQEITPVAITQPKPGVFVADLGQNFAGWDRLRVRGAAGTKVTLRHAEILNADGTVYTANLRAAQATDTFTLAGTGADEVFEPRFTVHGYRYVEITGFPGTPTTSSLTGLAAWTAGAATGTFTTSDAMINSVQHAILWGARSNLLSIPTDCPQRDERLGWTGDIAAFAATSTFNFDTRGLLGKFADDLTDAQRPDGAFTDVAPFVSAGSGTAGWGDAGVIVPYQLWQRYGDLRVVDEHFDAMARWIEYLRSTAGGDLIRDHQTYGDWLNVDDNTANDLTSTAYFGWSTRLVARMAAATGRTTQAQTYSALADQIAAAFANRFIAADGTVSGNTQTGYVLALAFGLVPAARVQAVADKLAAKVATRDGHLSVGFMGVENLLPVLAEHNHLDTAYQILRQPGYPGWGYMISRGATTIWERWDGIRTDGTLQDPGMNSFNHYGLGSVGDWLYRTVGGVAPATPGYGRVLIAPRPGGGLTSATSDLTTAYGRTRSSWTKSGSTLTMSVTVPPNATATVRVPASSAASVNPPAEAVPLGYTGGTASYALPSGDYTFTVTG